MAVLYITEYAGMMPSPDGKQGQVPMEPPLAEQTVAIGAEAKSSAFSAKTRLIRMHCDATCSVLIGTAPTATTASGRMVQNQTEFRGVPVTGTYKVSVISNT